MYTLIADGGDLTAGRRTASYVYGDWNVSVPDGDEQIKLDEKLGDGFVCRINNGRRLGRFDHTFVKEDVSIDMESKTTDLEAVVEDVFGRTSGDLYFQRDITGVGLNGSVPLRDYNIGDPVRVVRWGKAIPTIVTGIRVSSDKDDRRGYTVHVGGELIKNRRLSNKLSDELRRQVARELVDVRNDIGETNRNSRRAVTTAGNANTKADNAVATAKVAKDTAYDTWNKVVSVNGEIQGYVKETGDLVEQARESARRAKDSLLDIDPKLFEVREAVASAQRLKTAVDERLDGVGSELDDAITESKAKIIDPAVKQVTGLLQQATTANREAIRLNNEADGFRDQALTDLTDASDKLKKSQANLTEATAKNSDAVDKLRLTSEALIKITKETGTATEALRRSDVAQNKALAAVEQAQKTETEMRLKAQAAQEQVNARLDSQDLSNQEYFQAVQVSLEQVALMGNRQQMTIDRSIGVNKCVVYLYRSDNIIKVYNQGNSPVVLTASATLIRQGLITNTTGSVLDQTVTLNPHENTILFEKKPLGYVHNVIITTKFTPVLASKPLTRT